MISSSTLSSTEVFSAQVYLNSAMRLLGEFPRTTDWEALLEQDGCANKSWLESLKQEIEDAHKGHEADLVKLPNLQILYDMLNRESCSQFAILDNLIAGVGAIRDCLNCMASTNELIRSIPDLADCEHFTRLDDAREILDRIRDAGRTHQATMQDILEELRNLQTQELKQIFPIPVPKILREAYTLTGDNDHFTLIQRMVVARELLKPESRRTEGAYLAKINELFNKRMQTWNNFQNVIEQTKTDLEIILS